jgi:glucose-6-phosphate isomerase
MLPAALVGVDVAAMLDGAGDMAQRCASETFGENPAAVYATLQHAADVKYGRHIHVFMPYSDPLRDMADWFVQLWAESLGKHRKPGDAGFGPTPLAALGATDQHSQVQLFMEGPFDKVITFVRLEQFGTDLPIPAPDHTGVPERVVLPADLSYLPGHTLGELLNAEYEATSAALAEMGRMNCTLRLPELTPEAVGELIMFFQLATGYAGVWYGIDPFDQPGVELGKRLTYAAMGRPGYDAGAGSPAPLDEA